MRLESVAVAVGIAAAAFVVAAAMALPVILTTCVFPFCFGSN